MTIPLLPDEHHIAAWWSSVIEPGDVYAHALRLALGDDEAIAWVCADTPGSLPLGLGDCLEALASTSRGRRPGRGP